MLSLIALLIFIQAVAVAPVARSFKRPLRIQDVSWLGDKVVIACVQQHHIKNGKTIIPVSFEGTGHFLLDRKDANYQVRLMDSMRVELLDEKGERVDARMDSSMGRMRIPFPRDLTCTTSPLLLSALEWCLLVSVVPWVIVIVMASSHTFQGRYEDASYALLVLGAAVFVGAIASVAAMLWWRRGKAKALTPMERRLAQFRNEIAQRCPKPTPCPRGPHRAVEVELLSKLLHFFSDFIQMRTAYYLDPNVVRPLTRPHQMSFAEMVGPKDVNYFVSHFWGTAFPYFVETVTRHARQTGRQDWNSLSYWVCFLSNNQWDISAELGGGNWWESSFYLALRSGICLGTCMVLDADALPLSRSWCLFEVVQTYRLEKDEAKFANFSGLHYCTNRGVIGSTSDTECFDISIAVARKLAGLKLEEASATNKDDEVMIANLVEQEGGFPAMNSFIRENMGRTLAGVQKQFGDTMKDLEANLQMSRTPSLAASTEVLLDVDPPSGPSGASITSGSPQAGTASEKALMSVVPSVPGSVDT